LAIKIENSPEKNYNDAFTAYSFFLIRFFGCWIYLKWNTKSIRVPVLWFFIMLQFLMRFDNPGNETIICLLGWPRIKQKTHIQKAECGFLAGFKC
jgi:hypothetical protein